MPTDTSHSSRSCQCRPWGLVFGLSWSDLQHEWILSGCLIMAVTAVLAPLLILFGLKYGTIETLRMRLVQDPRNREIRPLASRTFSHDWFDQLRQRPDVAFLVPMTRRIAAIVTATGPLPAESEKVALNLIPTQSGDPLLLENGAPIPKSGECVLTHLAAEQLQARQGDTIHLSARRFTRGRYEAGTIDVRVAGVLTARASDLTSIYVQLQLLEDVERYKDGQAVPALGWPGSTPIAYPRYNGLIVILPQALGHLERLELQQNTGFTQIETLNKNDLQDLTGWQLNADVTIYFLSTQKTPVGQESVDVVQRKLRGQQAVLLPWIIPLQASVRDSRPDEDKILRLYVLSIDRSTAELLDFKPLPPWATNETSPKIMLPAIPWQIGQDVILQLTYHNTSLKLPFTSIAAHDLSQDIAFIPAELGGQLNLFRERNVTYDVSSGKLVLSRKGYAAFRLYAKTIDDVERLRRYFTANDLPVHTEAQRIQEVKDLDRRLALLFFGIAAVSILGGMTALLASLYAAVERKQYELGVLRLLGISRRSLCLYPIYQGLLIGMGGVGFAILVYSGMTVAINSWFRDHLAPGESFCRMPALSVVAAIGITLLVAVVASSCAAWRVTTVDPADALRHE